MLKAIRFVLLCSCLMGAWTMAWGSASDFWRFPKLPGPQEYGNILMNRLSEKNGQQAVTFSHWSHRLRHTCRVCHLELEFKMELNTTEITEKMNRNGRYCGACHDGVTAFGHRNEAHCGKCHNGDIAAGTEKFKELFGLPQTPFGNRIDWVTAYKQGTIKPKQSILDDQYKPLGFNKPLEIEAAWVAIPQVYFPHEAHNQWLDCSNCHPDIFNVEKKTTEHFSMKYILERKFCGVCHWKVAFPLDDCKRCHPTMED